MAHSQLWKDLVDEVAAQKVLHPKVEALVSAFIAYLKEPRYKNPLTLAELSHLFQEFYKDLTSLVCNVYTQLNTNKRALLQNSEVFRSDTATFDYLNAIANYSSSLLKLVKRSDPLAKYQLRVFAFYKFLTVTHVLKMAESHLLSSANASDLSTLCDKLFRFDARDIELQTLLTEKMAILKDLGLPLACFFETSYDADSRKIEVLLSSPEVNASFAKVKTKLLAFATAQIPSKKIHLLASLQKHLIEFCASSCGKDPLKISNDILLPVFIYVLIYHSPSDVPLDLYLNLVFVKNFWNMLNPQTIDVSRFTLSTSLYSYDPTASRGSKNPQGNLFELLNLTSVPDTEAESEKQGTQEFEPEFESDSALMSCIQTKYLNNGEFQFYLTNFDAILYFLMSSPLRKITPVAYELPQSVASSPLANLSLDEILESRVKSQPIKDIARITEQEFEETTRSRSSSILNAITNTVTYSGNRSRSNSAQLANTHDTVREAALHGDTELVESGLSRVRNIFGKIGLVSTLQFRPALDFFEPPVASDPAESPLRAKLSQLVYEKLSPSHTRTRSGSLETPGAQATTIHGSLLRRSTFSSKLSNGVNDLITKINYAATTPADSITNPISHASQISLHSTDDLFENTTYAERSTTMGPRSSSVQTMEKWFNNIPGGAAEHRSNNSISSNRGTALDGSIFSASFGEMTKYQNVDFESLTISDLKAMKKYYDQLCTEVLARTDSKTSQEELVEEQENAE